MHKLKGNRVDPSKHAGWAADCPPEEWRTHLNELPPGERTGLTQLRRREKNRRSAVASAQKKKEEAAAAHAAYENAAKTAVEALAANARLSANAAHYAACTTLRPPAAAVPRPVAACAGILVTRDHKALVVHHRRGKVVLAGSESATHVSIGGGGTIVVGVIQTFAPSPHGTCVVWSAAMGVVLCERLLPDACIETAAAACGGAAMTATRIFTLPLNGAPAAWPAEGPTALAIDNATATVIWGTHRTAMAAGLAETSAPHSLFGGAIAAPTCIAAVGDTAIVLGRPNGVRILTRNPDTHIVVILEAVIAVAADDVVAVLCRRGVIVLDFNGAVLGTTHPACTKDGLSVAGRAVWADGLMVQYT